MCSATVSSTTTADTTVATRPCARAVTRDAGDPAAKRSEGSCLVGAPPAAGAGAAGAAGDAGDAGDAGAEGADVGAGIVPVVDAVSPTEKGTLRALERPELSITVTLAVCAPFESDETRRTASGDRATSWPSIDQTNAPCPSTPSSTS